MGRSRVQSKPLGKSTNNGQNSPEVFDKRKKNRGRNKRERYTNIVNRNIFRNHNLRGSSPLSCNNSPSWSFSSFNNFRKYITLIYISQWQVAPRCAVGYGDDGRYDLAGEHVGVNAALACMVSHEQR